MPICLMNSVFRFRSASDGGKGPKKETKDKESKLSLLYKVFSSSGASMLSHESMGMHDVHIELENDIPENISPAINKKPNENCRKAKDGEKDGLVEEYGKLIHEGPLTEFTYVAGDFSGMQRKGVQLANAISPTDKLAREANIQAMLQATGVLTGYVASARGHKEGMESYHLGDDVGLTTGIATTIRGPFEMLSGGTGAAAGGISAFSPKHHSASIASALKGLTIASAVGSGGFYILLGFPAATSLYESGSMYHNLKKEIKKGGEKQGFTFLQDKLRIQDSDREKILDELFTDKQENPVVGSIKRFFNWLYNYDTEKVKEVKGAIHELLEKDELNSDEINKALAALDPNHELEELLTEEDKAFAESYINKHEKLQNLSPEAKENLIRITSVFYKVGLNVISAKKEKQLGRMIGKEALTKVMENATLNVDDIDKETIESTIKSAKSGLIKSMAINIAIVVACILGFVATVLGTIFTGGIFPLVCTIVSIIVLSVWTGLDAYTLYQKHKEGEVSTKDKILMALSLVFNVAIVVLGTVVTGGLVGTIITAVLTVGWFILLAYTLYTWRKKKGEEKGKQAEEEKINIRRLTMEDVIQRSMASANITLETLDKESKKE